MRARAALLPAVASAVTACAQLSGIDEYSVASDAAAAPLPGRPLFTGPACEACLAQSCTEQDAACRADAECAAYLDCVRNHTDPTPNDCVAPTAFEALHTCALNSCDAACWAPDLRCVGRYSWPSGQTASARLTLHPIVLGGSIEGFTAKACSVLDLRCDPPVAQATDDDLDGTVELDVPLGGTFASSSPSFVGRFRYEHPSLLTTYHDPGRPIWGDEVLTPAMPTADLNSSLYQNIGGFDPARATVGVQILDCTGHPPSGVLLELSPKDETAQVFYWLNGAPTSTARATSAAAGGVASVSYAPAGLFVLTASDQATRAVLSARQVVAEPGALYILWMWPLTSTEQ